MKIGVINASCSDSSASNLASIIGAEYLGQKYKESLDFTEYDVLFNYGVSNLNILVSPKVHIINHPNSIKKCVNKLKTFYAVYKDCNTVSFTEKPEKALTWLDEDGIVVARALTNGSQCGGLEYIYNKDQFKGYPAKFWTRYFHNEHEVRINVFRNKVISVYEKYNEDDETKFTHLKITGESPEVSKMISTISSNIGIEFYGMDVLVSPNGECKLLEVNTAPILHDETLTAIKANF